MRKFKSYEEFEKAAESGAWLDGAESIVDAFGVYPLNEGLLDEGLAAVNSFGDTVDDIMFENMEY